MKFSDIFLEAARQLVEGNGSFFSCWTVSELDGHGIDHANSPAARYYVALMSPNGGVQHFTWAVNDMSWEERQAWRVLALLFAYEAAKSEGL